MNELYQQAFERFTANGGSRGPAGVLASRRQAFAHFARVGFPTVKDEEWRFTPITPIVRAPWRLDRGIPGRQVNADELRPFRFGDADWCTLVFVDGHFAPGLSHRPALAAGICVEPLSEALSRDPALLEGTFARTAAPDLPAFAALNTAFAADGAVVQIPAGIQIEQPLHLLYVTTQSVTGAAVQVRTLLQVGRGARLQVVESYAGLERAELLSNVVTEVEVAEGAWVEHTRIQRENPSAYHIGLTQVAQARDSHYRSFTLAEGGAIARHDLRARLSGENVETLLYGLYLGRDEQLVDNHTTIFHDEPNCRSWEVYKGILDGHSRAVFNGKVLVQPEAQKTDAKQTNRNLLLSTGAKVDTKPQLEIFADDVKCTHGATVGRIDESAFFYLQSRGIPRAHAQRILTYAFAAEVVNEVASAPVRRALDQLVASRLGVRS